MELTAKKLRNYIDTNLTVDVNYCGLDIQATMCAIYNGGEIECHSLLSTRFYEYKPHMRKLSSLTKEITVNGNKIIPIVELAKISSIYDYSDCRFEYEEDDNEVYCNIINGGCVIWCLAYDYIFGSFYNYEDGSKITKYCQFELFECLIAMHFWLWSDEYFDNNLLIEIKD